MATRIVTIDDEIDGENEVVEGRVVVLGVERGVVVVRVASLRWCWWQRGGCG